MNSSQLIEKLNKFYNKLETDEKYSFLIKGKWGIGKTHTYDRFIEKKSLENKSYKYSLFGMKDLRELEKELLKDRFFPTIKKLQDGAPKKVISNILSGVLKSLPIGKEIVESIDPSKLIELLSIKDLDYDENSLVCLDDFERCDIPVKDLMGFIERLEQKTNIIVLCNEKEMEVNQLERYKVYKSYKEKVIDFTYSLEEVEDKIVLRKLSTDLKLSADMENMILGEFKKYCKDNLRVLEKFIHLHRELTSDLEKYNLNQNSKKKVIRSCFYLSCEENLNLIEEYIKKKKLSEDWQDNYEEVVRNNLYSNVYKFEYGELIEEIKKYLLGSKECIDNIILNLKVEVEETLEFLERINLYFLSDTEGVKRLLGEILEFVKKSNKNHYINTIIVLKLYSYYLLFSEITNKETDECILSKIEGNLYSLVKEGHYLRDPYEFCNEDSDLEKDVYFNYNGGLEENIKVKLRELRKNFDERRKGEILEATESLLKEKRYSEVYEEVKYWSHIPEFILEYLKNSIKREISMDEWDLWSAIVKNTKGDERKKVKEIINGMDKSDKVTKLRIDYFLKKMD